MKKKIFGILGLLIMFAFIGVAWASITFQWDAPTDGGPVIGYNLHYRLQGSSDDTIIKVDNVTEITTSVFDSLPSGYYEAWICAYNNKLDGMEQEGGASNIVVVTVDVEPPGACSNFEIN